MAVFYPFLCNTHSEVILGELENREGVNIENYDYSSLRHANYTVLNADSENLQRMTNVVFSEGGVKTRLSVNIKKSDCMSISKNKSRLPCSLNTNREIIK